MKIGQLIAYLILLSQFNLSSQKWIVHEIDRSNSSKMVQDCKGNILFIRGLTVVTTILPVRDWV